MMVAPKLLGTETGLARALRCHGESREISSPGGVSLPDTERTTTPARRPSAGRCRAGEAVAWRRHLTGGFLNPNADDAGAWAARTRCSGQRACRCRRLQLQKRGWGGNLAGLGLAFARKVTGGRPDERGNGRYPTKPAAAGPGRRRGGLAGPRRPVSAVDPWLVTPPRRAGQRRGRPVAGDRPRTRTGPDAADRAFWGRTRSACRA